MKTESISVPYFEWYRCIGLKPPCKGDYVLSMQGDKLLMLDRYLSIPMVVYEKIPPRRYVFEETGEYRPIREGEFYSLNGEILRWRDSLESYLSYKVLKVVDE